MQAGKVNNNLEVRIEFILPKHIATKFLSQIIILMTLKRSDMI